MPAPLRLALRVCALILAWFSSTTTAGAQQPTTVGFIKLTAGSAVVLRTTQTHPATGGMALQQGDVLRTGADGKLGVTLKDGTRLSLGPNTEVALKSFAFSPADRQLGFVMSVVKGVVDYVSGRIAKLAPDAVKIETPTSVIGVRGTHLLLGAAQP